MEICRIADHIKIQDEILDGKDIFENEYEYQVYKVYDVDNVELDFGECPVGSTVNQVLEMTGIVLGRTVYWFD